MKLHYYPETDSLYVELASTPSAEAREIVEGLIADFDANGNVVGLDRSRVPQARSVKGGDHCTAASKRGGVMAGRPAKLICRRDFLPCSTKGGWEERNPAFHRGEAADHAFG